MPRTKTTEERPNPARDLLTLATQIVHYGSPNASMKAFFSERHRLKDPDLAQTVQRMLLDMCLPGKAIEATQAVLGERADHYLQWRGPVENAFSSISLKTKVNQVGSHLQGEPLVHLSYCASRLDELEVSEDLQELLDAIQTLRDDVASMSLSGPITKQVNTSLIYLEGVVWDRLYGKLSGEAIAGAVIKNVGELRSRRLPKGAAEIVRKLAHLTVRICYPMFAHKLLEAGEPIVESLLEP